MRPIVFGISAGLASFLLAHSPAGAQDDPPAAQDVRTVFRSIFEQLNPVPPRDPDRSAIEGLPKDERGEVLTWERAYALALVRSRDKGKPLAPTLDPMALDEQAARLEVADFARFRREFLAGEGGGFLDPSARYFDLLGRSKAIEHAAAHLAAVEQLAGLLGELIKGESSGLSQIQMDEASRAIERARLELAGRQTRYRDALDEFKLELGLSPQAPVALDRGPLARFKAVFEKFSRWAVDPRREFDKLSGLASELPRLGDLTIDGRSLLETVTPDSPRFEELVSITGRGAPDPSLELVIRRRARKLGELATIYQISQRQFALIFVLRDRVFEQLIAPPTPNMSSTANGAISLAKLIEFEHDLRDCKDRLINTWTSYHSIRMALYRDRKTLPFGDWKAFYDQGLALGVDSPGAPPRRGSLSPPGITPAPSGIPIPPPR